MEGGGGYLAWNWDSSIWGADVLLATLAGSAGVSYAAEVCAAAAQTLSVQNPTRDGCQLALRQLCRRGACSLLADPILSLQIFITTAVDPAQQQNLVLLQFCYRCSGIV